MTFSAVRFGLAVQGLKGCHDGHQFLDRGRNIELAFDAFAPITVLELLFDCLDDKVKERLGVYLARAGASPHQVLMLVQPCCAALASALPPV